MNIQQNLLQQDRRCSSLHDDFLGFCCLSLSLDSMFLAVLTSLLCILQEANKAPDSWFELKVNTHVYVTGLPDDVTAAEVS